MRVLLVDVNYQHSSTGKIVHDLKVGLQKKGHDVLVCFGRGVESDASDVEKIASNAEVIAHAGLARLTGLVGYFSPFATRKLIEMVEDFSPDVVHLHELHGYYVNIIDFVGYLKARRIKVVWTFHCEFMYTGRCGHANDCERWKTTCHNCPQLREYPKSLIFDFSKEMQNEKKELFTGFDNITIVTPSTWLADRVSQSFLREKRIEVIYNGIDTELFCIKDYGFLKARHGLKDEMVLLAVAPDLMSEGKGGRWIVELASFFVGQPVKFILIGVSDLTQSFGENVIALPLLTDQAELAAYYSMAALTLLPSKKETFSLVTVESLACGTPVLGFDSGAPVEVAPEGYGHFVEYADMAALKKSLSEFLGGSSSFRNAQECVEFSSKRYSKEKMFESYLRLYADEYIAEEAV
ncbi:glycosyltransferase [Pseudomonas sp. NPDC089530]|uniref:glycosyltransferase n=1 Tax=Pseudomonas sp. NPDC089530 TaxID=3390651 RepID=UPI003D023484